MIEKEKLKSELCYSPDDGGWYWLQFKPDNTSKVYVSKNDAIADMKSGNVQWEGEEDE